MIYDYIVRFDLKDSLLRSTHTMFLYNKVYMSTWRCDLKLKEGRDDKKI